MLNEGASFDLWKCIGAGMIGNFDDGRSGSVIDEVESLVCKVVQVSAWLNFGDDGILVSGRRETPFINVACVDDKAFRLEDMIGVNFHLDASLWAFYHFS